MRLAQFLALVAMALVFVVTAVAQVPNVQIDAYDGGYQPCEPSPCHQPSRPRRVVAGSILDNVYTPRRGRWTKDRSSLGVFGDPWWPTSGDFYFCI